jgi:hypothetical protein
MAKNNASHPLPDCLIVDRIAKTLGTADNWDDAGLFLEDIATTIALVRPDPRDRAIGVGGYQRALDAVHNARRAALTGMLELRETHVASIHAETTSVADIINSDQYLDNYLRSLEELVRMAYGETVIPRTTSEDS